MDAVRTETMQTTEVAGEAPAARLYGQPVLELPKDLYIPPDALRVFPRSL